MSPGLIARIKRWEWRLLLLLIYVLPLKEAPKNVIWGVLIFFFLIRAFASKNWIWPGKVGSLTVAWIAAGAVSSFLAIEPYVSWKGLWDLIRSASFLWILASHVRKDGQMISLVRHVVLSAVIASLMGLGELAWKVGIEKKELWMARVGLPSVGHPNQSGIYLSMCWLLAVVAVIRREVLGSSALGFICLAILGVTLFGTMARVALAVAAISTVFVVYKNRHLAPRWLPQLIVGGACLGGLAVLASSSMRMRFLFRGSFSSRTVIWNNVLDAIWQRPWSGVGLNNFKNIVVSGAQDGIHLTTDHAHNVYLNALVQTGIIGFIIFLFLMAVTGAMIFKFYFSDAHEKVWAAYAVGSVWVVIAGVGFSATSLHHEMAMLFFILIGAMAGLQLSLDVRGDRDVRKTAAITQKAPSK